MPNKEPIPDFPADSEAFPRWTDWGPRQEASLVLPRLDYEAQLVAITGLLSRNTLADRTAEAEADALYEDARKASGYENERATEAWIDTVHELTYQNAAHGMAAAGMLAPLCESLFTQAFHGIRSEFFGSLIVDVDAGRGDGNQVKFWNCQWFMDDRGKFVRNISLGVPQLAKATGLHALLPESLWKVWDALFSYRNMMFHNGFEWPQDRCVEFAERIEENGWKAWFSSATRDDEPWIFYMTQSFVDECLDHVHKVLEAIGKYVAIEIERELDRVRQNRAKPQ
jgi:hypothetical protein